MEQQQPIALQNSEATVPPPTPEDISADPELDASTQVTLPVGMRIDDRYEILGTLGVGGFATVYRAHHLTIDRDVALKVMDLKKGVDPSYSERFFREAKIAAKIHHNNVVSIYDFGHVSETKQPYIAMEMLYGRDLSHELEEVGPLSPKRMYVLFRPVLDALAEGHRLGIVHKDLKPENLYLVDPGGSRELMKILDFGVARVNSSEVAKLTTAGQLLGTPRYLAPEYIKSQTVSPAIDVYQMALIISEALTGIPAVTGDPFHAMMLHCSGKLQISSFLLEGPVGDVFRKAISIDPAQRYADCGEFARALDSVEPYFESNVPLQGGAPQIVPDGGGANMSGRISGPYSGSQITGSLESMEIARNSGPYATSNKRNIVIVALVAFVLIAAILGVVGVKLMENKNQARLTEEELKRQQEEQERLVAQMEKIPYEFHFESDPPGAQVLIKGNEIDIDAGKTPCDYIFYSRRGELKELVVFKNGGYKEKNVYLSSDLCKKDNENCVAQAKLEKLVVAPKTLVFKLVYIPANASAYILENGEKEVICDRSPCSYVFDVSKKAVTINFSANSYEPYSVVLTEEEYNKNSTINVELSRKKKNDTQGTTPPLDDKDKDKDNKIKVEKCVPNTCKTEGSKIKLCNKNQKWENEPAANEGKYKCKNGEYKIKMVVLPGG